ELACLGDGVADAETEAVMLSEFNDHVWRVSLLCAAKLMGKTSAPPRFYNLFQQPQIPLERTPPTRRQRIARLRSLHDLLRHRQIPRVMQRPQMCHQIAVAHF